MLKTETAGSKQITIVYVILTIKVGLNNLIQTKEFFGGAGVVGVGLDGTLLKVFFFFSRFSKGRHSVILTHIVDVRSSQKEILMCQPFCSELQ